MAPRKMASAAPARRYHHRRPELSNALAKAQQHLGQALRIQTRQLGPLHVSTLCSQLVKAQVMLLQDNETGCERLLKKQFQFCEETLSPSHPLAAKMLAVLARLKNRQGKEAECEALPPGPTPPRPRRRPRPRPPPRSPPARARTPRAARARG